MSESLEIKTERVDDLPVILAQLDKIQLAAKLDQHFPTHGNWQGISLGKLTTIWLTHLLSEANHRLNHLERWAKKRMECLERCLGQSLRRVDFSDDRLARVLDYLSNEEKWQAFEQDLGQHLVRVYDLSPTCVRLDSTTSFSYTNVTEEGLFQFGHSKDHRGDLPQLKIQMSSLDPLGLPLSTSVVSGEKADDPLYLPEITKIQATLQKKGVLFVGDCKMAALATRAYLADSGDFYLCPLSAVQADATTLQDLLTPIENGEVKLHKIYSAASAPNPGAGAGGEEEHCPREKEDQPPLAEGYELVKYQTSQVKGKAVEWQERWLVVRSLKLAEHKKAELTKRLDKALAELNQLNGSGRGKRRFREVGELQSRVERILEHYGVRELVEFNCQQFFFHHQVRRYGERESGIRTRQEFRVVARKDQAAIAKAQDQLGWQIYVSNQPVEGLSLEQAVLAYRGEYIIERGFERLKGKPLSLRPMYLSKENRIVGLVRFLTLGLRVLSLLEYKVREKLAQQGAKLAGLYEGNPRRATARPSSEKLLAAFEYITLSRVVQKGQIHYHLTGLSMLQSRILSLLDLPTDLFSRLISESHQPPLQMREP